MRKYAQSTWFIVLALVAILLQAKLILLALFGPGLDYEITRTPYVSLESEDFVDILRVLSDAQVYRNTKIEVLPNGEVYYDAELAAIRQAKQSINLEAYIFQKGEVTRRFIEALTERARAGVRVNLVLDAVGSMGTPQNDFTPLLDAGGNVALYHPMRWYTWPRFNNRTHRELIIIDGTVGFIGGSGFADHWLLSKEGSPRWRDTMFRVEGEAVAGLQSSFVENWVEASGEILTGKEYFPFEASEGDAVALIVNSSPSAGRSTRARMIFQTFLASARNTLYITTPYFLPDRSVRAELIRAVKERGVDVKVLVPNDYNDHLLVRRSSRRLYGELLQAGIRIYEYQASMLHVKTLVVDGLWSVVGTTNLDNRSFGLNDEVNLASRDPKIASRLVSIFNDDLSRSRRITYEEWRDRSFVERFEESIAGLLERQQ
jgi:cardiolipin synthase